MTDGSHGTHDLDATMSAHARAFASQHDALDGTPATLAAFDVIVGAMRPARGEHAGSLLGCGAYLGEVMRGASRGALRWVDRAGEPASRAPLPDETRWALVSSTSTWFPLAKIAKFLAGGAADSPAAFAEVALATLATPAPSAIATLSDADQAAIGAFLSAPSPDTLRELSAVFDRNRRAGAVEQLRAAGLTARALFPLFAVKPTKGRHGQSRRAGDHAWLLLRDAVDPADRARLAEMLTDADTTVRETAARVSARLAIHEARLQAFIAQFAVKDAAVKLGTLDALAALTSDAVMDRVPMDDVSGYLPVLEGAMLRAPLRALALETIHRLTARLRADVTPFLGVLLGVLRDGKPAEVEVALDALTSHLYAVAQGRSPSTSHVHEAVGPIVSRTHAAPGNVKTTKVQIAARYALDALLAAEKHLPEADRVEVRAAVASMARVR